MDRAIRVKNVSKRFRMYTSHAERLKELMHPFGKRYHQEFWALKNVTLDVPRGAAFGIVGPNGCGKSTLLQVICGILRPTTGAVEVNGRVSALLELGAGFSQDFTGAENVFMQGAIMGIGREEMERRFSDIVKFAEIGDFIDQPVKTYSSGMFVRLAFAVAINVDPDILIVDEALAVGDAAFQTKCYSKIKDFREQGRTMLVVSHDLQTLKTFCDGLVLLEKGTVRRIGDPDAVIEAFADLWTAHERERINIDPLAGMDLVQNKAGNAEITDLRILDEQGKEAATIRSGETHTVRAAIIFKKDIPEPVGTLRIKDLAGGEIAGVSTAWSDPLGPVHAGDRIVIEFTQRLPLNPGHYVLSLDISEFVENSSFPLDQKTDHRFEITGKTRFSGIVDTGSEIKVLRGQ